MTFKRLSRYGYRQQMRLVLLDTVTERKDTKGYAVELRGGTVEVLTGKEKGEVSDGKLPAQRLSVIRFGTVRSLDYNIQMEVHPELVRNARSEFIRIMEPQEENQLEVYVTPRCDIDLTSLDYVVRIYLNE